MCEQLRSNRECGAVHGGADTRRRLRSALRRCPRESGVPKLELNLLRPQTEKLGSDHRHHGVSSGTDITRRACYVCRSVSAIRDLCACVSLKCAPDTGCHSPTDQKTSVAHRTRLVLAVFPTELFRAESVAFAQRFARPGLSAFGIHLGAI